MNKIRKILLTTGALLVLSASSVAIASCKDKNTVKFVFETAGGEEISSVEIKVGQEYALPIPEREGYSFEGWYVNADFSGDPVTSVVASTGATYYAKWAKLVAVTLELDGGQLTESSLYLKEGGNVYDFMQSYVPQKEGLVFGAWFYNGVELGKNQKMPAEGITLTARYKVAYKVELWKQALGSAEYVKDETDIQGYAYVSEEFVSTQKPTGFKEVFVEGENGTVTEMVLSANSSENVFRHYFDRESYTVSFNANYPDGTQEDSRTVTVTYGEEVAVPSDYLFEGYCLMGWSTSATGEVLYESDFLYNALYNKDEAEAPSQGEVTFKPERNTALYAVWNKGYVDMFGNDDYIYLLDAESEIVYLSRGSVFFQGEYNANRNEFTFIGSNGKALLRGKLLEDGTYTYYQDSRRSSNTLYEVGTGLVETDVLYFDEYNGITYSVADDAGITTQSVGTYTVDENGYYVATFTEGEGAYVGKTLTLVIGSVTVDGVATPAFQVRNEEEYGMGELVMFVVYEGSLTYYTSVYQMILTGFGTAIMNMGMSTSTYYYTLEEDILTLRNAYGQDAGVARIMEYSGKKGYMLYTEELDQTFSIANGGELVLDGLCNATYTVNGATVSGYYTTASSVFGGTLVTFEASEKTYKFLISSTTEEHPVEGGEEGETEMVTVYSAAEKLPTYAEYYYQDAEGTYYAPMFVIDDPQEGTAILYGYTSARVYVEVSRGTYEYNEETGLYVYTAKTFADAELLTEVLVDPWDLLTVQACVFALDTTTTSYSINYWYSVTTDEGTQSFDAQYTGANGETLTLVAGIAIYSANGYIVTGTYATSNGLTTITTSSGSLYLELNEEDKTLVALTSAPYSAYILAADGSSRQDAAITFDGKGGATYSELVTNDAGESVQVDYVGTFTQTTETTPFGAYVYLFEATDGSKSFKFLQLTTSSAAYIAMYNETYNGEYEASAGILSLDGYGYMASYASSNGTLYEGVYFVLEENVICLLTADSEYIYFDLLSDRSFTVRDEVYGSYYVVNNQAMLNFVLELDGYGKLTVYTVEEDEEGELVRVDIDTEGTYSSNGNVYTLTYKNGAETVTLVGELSVADSVFFVSRKEAMQTFVNKVDWSVMILDDLGNATKYSADGVKLIGSYMLITDELLYFVNEDGTEANIYKYNVQQATVEPILLESRGYYTEGLESLLFTEYGFAIFDGTTRYYYNIVDDNVTIYRQDANNENANKYGFVEENFGEFAEDTVEYDGKTYYYNDGYALTFKRAESSKDKYPVLVKEGATEEEADIYSPLEDLVFAPTGAAEFSGVTGTVRVYGENYTCYVTRRINDEGAVEMYVEVGSYRFDIKVSYTGLNSNGESTSTYEVTRMRLMQSYQSYMYMQMYYMYYMFYGSNYASMITNDLFGTVSISREFHEDGSEFEGGPYFNAEFGELSGMYDANGDLISIDGAEYEEDENGIMTVEFVAKDGYTYRLYVGRQANQIFQAYGYVVYALTRVHNLETENGYNVYVERVIATEAQGVYVGYPLTVTLKQGETEIPSSNLLLMDGYVYYISRTYAENEDGTQGKITSTTYYRIEFAEDTAGGVVEDDENIILAYTGATVTAEAAVTYYNADTTSYVDIVGEEVKLLSFNGTLYLATRTVAYAEGGYYARTYNVGFDVKIAADGTATIETATTVYTQDGYSFVDILNDEIKFLVIQGTSVEVTSCVKNADGSYTVTTEGDRKFTVIISEEGVATIEQIEGEPVAG